MSRAFWGLLGTAVLSYAGLVGCASGEDASTDDANFTSAPATEEPCKSGLNAPVVEGARTAKLVMRNLFEDLLTASESGDAAAIRFEGFASRYEGIVAKVTALKAKAEGPNKANLQEAIGLLVENISKHASHHKERDKLSPAFVREAGEIIDDMLDLIIERAPQCPTGN
jgi:hypothetical protein